MIFTAEIFPISKISINSYRLPTSGYTSLFKFTAILPVSKKKESRGWEL